MPLWNACLLMSEQSRHDWIEKTQERIKNLEAVDLSDRLACYVALWKIIGAVGNSVSGWRSWLVRPGIMTEFTEEEMKEFCLILRDMAIQFLNFDMKATEKFKTPPPPPRGQPERRYWT